MYKIQHLCKEQYITFKVTFAFKFDIPDFFLKILVKSSCYPLTEGSMMRINRPK